MERIKKLKKLYNTSDVIELKKMIENDFTLLDGENNNANNKIWWLNSIPEKISKYKTKCVFVDKN